MYALITGASSGIGREIASLLAKRGYNLIVSARREERLLELKEALENGYGIKVVPVVSDLSESVGAQLLFNFCTDYDVEVLVNNAGFGKVGFFDDIELKSETDMIDVNIKSLHILTKLFSGSMKKGYILNVASSAAFSPSPKMAAYAAAKAYVLSLSRAVNYENKKLKKPVSVSALCPGPVSTEFNDVAGADFKIKAITPQKCAQAAVKGMFKRKAVIVPGFKMKLAKLGTKLLPSCITLPVMYKIQAGKSKEKKK